MNLALVDAERDLIQRFGKPNHPVIFVVGPPRSGTTLLTQLLIRFLEIGYINNVAARFWNAPYIGVRLSSTLATELTPNTNFQSRYGSTSGYDGPHEFGHFWMRWFDYGETHCISEEQLAKIDAGQLLKELAAIESVFERPTLYKNLAACGMNAKFIYETIPGAIFIRLRRDPFRVACSLFAGRIANRGDPSIWFSVRPPDFSRLRTLPVPQQIVGQVASIEHRLDEFFDVCPEDAKIEIDFQQMIENPEGLLIDVERRLQKKGSSTPRRKGDLPILLDAPLPALDSEVLRALRVACDTLPT